MKTVILIKKSALPFFKDVAEDIQLNIIKTEKSYPMTIIQVTIEYNHPSQLYKLGLLTGKKAQESIY